MYVWLKTKSAATTRAGAMVSQFSQTRLRYGPAFELLTVTWNEQPAIPARGLNEPSKKLGPSREIVHGRSWI